MRKYLVGLCIGLLSHSISSLAATGDYLATTKWTNLYRGPSESQEIVLRLQSQEPVVELGRQQGWVRIAVKSNGLQGWVPSSETVPLSAAFDKKRVSQLVSEANALTETSLWVLGYPTGFRFDGLSDHHRFEFTLPVIEGGAGKDATMVLGLRPSTPDDVATTVKVTVDGVPVGEAYSLRPDFGQQQIQIPFKLPATQTGKVKIAIIASITAPKNRCSDKSAQKSYLQISPETKFFINYTPQRIITLHDAWEVLPQDISLSLSANPLDESFASAWALSTLLDNDGKRVAVKQLPDIGDVVMSSMAEFEGALRQQFPQACFRRSPERNPNAPIIDCSHGEITFINAAENIYIVKTPVKTLIAVTPPFDPAVLKAASSSGWVEKEFELPEGAKQGDEITIPLAAVGVDNRPHQITRRYEWSSIISHHQLPAGTEPKSLELEVTAPKPIEGKRNIELHAFLNDVLVGIVPLDEGGVKHASIPLPARYQRSVNHIKIVAQNLENPECIEAGPGDFVQIGGGSALVLEKQGGDAPKRFSELRSYLAQGFDVYLPKGYVSKPDEALEFLMAITRGVSLPAESAKLYFIEEGQELHPQRPFVVIGRAGLSDSIIPIQFDQGSILIVDAERKPLLGDDEIHALTVAQIVGADGSYGLWIRPGYSGEKAALTDMRWSNDDVAFADARGVVLSLDSRDKTLANVIYPDVTHWYDIIVEYRYWLIAFVWLLLTIGILNLYRQTKLLGGA